MGLLTGYNFVFTGTCSKPRKELQSIVEENGGSVSSSITSSTDFLVAGENCGSKLDKAKKLSVKIIDESYLMDELLGDDFEDDYYNENPFTYKKKKVKKKTVKKQKPEKPEKNISKVGENDFNFLDI